MELYQNGEFSNKQKFRYNAKSKQEEALWEICLHIQLVMLLMLDSVQIASYTIFQNIFTSAQSAIKSEDNMWKFAWKIIIA